MDLCEKVARAGRGSSSFVSNANDNLNGKVIKALRRAIEPSLKDCSVTWNISGVSHKVDLGEAFRNHMISTTKIIRKDQLDKVNFDFESAHDPILDMPISVQYTSDEFEEY